MAQDQQYVTFGIDREIFAIPVEIVQEILDLQPVARLPRAPPYLLGLMDVRGAGMPVIDLRVKFGLPPIEPTNRTRVIIVEDQGASHPAIGLVADCVFEVTKLGGLELQPPPALGRTWKSDCVKGIGRSGENFVIVLELEKLLDANEFLIAEQTAA